MKQKGLFNLHLNKRRMPRGPFLEVVQMHKSKSKGGGGWWGGGRLKTTNYIKRPFKWLYKNPRCGAPCKTPKKGFLTLYFVSRYKISKVAN